MTTFYKYQGAGNDFLIADNRDGRIQLTAASIASLCHRRYGIGADGVMLLEDGPEGYDYRMVYYNSDGSGGMMCGNGGRCIVAFADRCGIKSHHFIAADGAHHAEITARNGECLTVKLGMVPVTEMTAFPQPDINGTFLDTGTRHLVVPVTGIGQYDVTGEGKRLRWREEFAPIGTNVNFIESDADTLHVRTFEKGVEDETYACGTGITASAIAYWHAMHTCSAGQMPVSIPIKALRDNLEVQFTPTPQGAADVFLIGPATYVAQIICQI